MVPIRHTIFAEKSRRDFTVAQDRHRAIRFWKDGVFQVVFAVLKLPHLTPALSAPNGAEREMLVAMCHAI
jgi:hypothetical protein